METDKEFQLKIAKEVLILNIVVSVIGSFFIDPRLPFITGIFFGTTISLLNFRLLNLTLLKAVKMFPGDAETYVTSGYIKRYLLTGFAILVSFKADYINILGTILGLISLKLIILKVGVLSNSQLYKNTKKRKEEK